MKNLIIQRRSFALLTIMLILTWTHENILAQGTQRSVITASNAASVIQLATKIPSGGGGVLAIAFTPDGKSVAAGGDDGIIRFWDIDKHKVIAQLEGHNGNIRSIAIDASGKYLASGGGDTTVRVWDLTTHEELVKLEGHSSNILCVAFSAAGNMLASGDENSTLNLWNWKDESVYGDPFRFSGAASSCNFSPDNNMLVAGSWDSNIYLFNAAPDPNSPLINTGKMSVGDVVIGVTFSPDNGMIYVANKERTVTVWDTKTQKSVNTFPLYTKKANKGHKDVLMAFAVSPNGEIFATGSMDSTAMLWDAAKGTQLNILSGHDNAVASIAFSPDGTMIATGSWDGTIRLWGIP